TSRSSGFAAGCERLFWVQTGPYIADHQAYLCIDANDRYYISRNVCRAAGRTGARAPHRGGSRMSTITKAKLGAKMALIGGHVVWERARRPRPATLAQVPPSTEALTREWLTAALFRAHPGARVESVRLGDRSDGSTSRQVLLLVYNDEGRATGLPERI